MATVKNIIKNVKDLNALKENFFKHTSAIVSEQEIYMSPQFKMPWDKKSQSLHSNLIILKKGRYQKPTKDGQINLGISLLPNWKKKYDEYKAGVSSIPPSLAKVVYNNLINIEKNYVFIRPNYKPNEEEFASIKALGHHTLITVTTGKDIPFFPPVLLPVNDQRRIDLLDSLNIEEQFITGKSESDIIIDLNTVK